MKHIPNIITLIRIFISFLLLLVDVKSSLFWGIYFLCGLSDILDGWLARRLKAVTKFGGILDSIADLCFVGCCCYALIPVLSLPIWIWYWTGAIAIIKIINQLSALALYRKCIFPHTVANKVTGLLLFICIPIIAYSIIPLCIVGIVATIAAIQERQYINRYEE